MYVSSFGLTCFNSSLFHLWFNGNILTYILSNIRIISLYSKFCLHIFRRALLLFTLHAIKEEWVPAVQVFSSSFYVCTSYLNIFLRGHNKLKNLRIILNSLIESLIICYLFMRMKIYSIPSTMRFIEASISSNLFSNSSSLLSPFSSMYYYLTRKYTVVSSNLLQNFYDCRKIIECRICKSLRNYYQIYP